MAYIKSFFDLQLRCAEIITGTFELPLQRVLLEYTNLYVRFGLGRDFRPEHPDWQRYLAGLDEAGDIGEWTYRFYLTRDEAMARPPVVATFGCFSYDLVAEDRIRIHFRNIDTEGCSSLGIAHIARRRADLAALFEHVRRNAPEDAKVVGISWLYNLDAYRRLFPASYIATARAVGNRFQGMSLWGQFLDRHGDLKEDMTRRFLTRLEEQTDVERLHEALPFQVLRVEAPVGAFYELYRLH